jgi:hypothetical protein
MARSYRNRFDPAVLQVADSTSARRFDEGQVIPHLRRLVLVPCVVVNTSPFLLPSLQ